MSIIFRDFSHLCCTFTGFKTVYGSFYEKKYSNNDVYKLRKAKTFVVIPLIYNLSPEQEEMIKRIIT